MLNKQYMHLEETLLLCTVEKRKDQEQAKRADANKTLYHAELGFETRHQHSSQSSHLCIQKISPIETPLESFLESVLWFFRSRTVDSHCISFEYEVG